MKLTKTLFILSVLISISSLAQKTITEKTYVVHVNNPDSLVEAHVYYFNPKLKTQEQRSYHWYDNNKIHSSVGGFDGKLLHGIYISSFPNNNLKEKGAYGDGLRTGEWIKWYPTGVIRETSNWKKGQRDGKYCLFSSGGQKVLEAEYNHGKLDGEVISYQDGMVKSTKRYKKGEEVKVKEEKKEEPKKKKERKPLKPKKVKLKPVQ